MRRIGFGLALSTMAVAALVVVAAAQIPDTLDERADLGERIDALRLEGDYSAAAALALRSLELSRSDTIAQAFEIEDAERLSETLTLAAALPESERAMLSAADSLAHVGELMWEAGRYADGIEVLEQELELRRAVLGDRHPEVATSLNNLAALTARQGDLLGAEVLYLEALELKREVLGEAHPEVALSLNNAASLRYAQGDYQTAEDLLREAIGLLTEAFGDDDPLTTASVLNLAGVMRAQGNYAGAEPLYRQVLASRREALGDDHPDVAQAMGTLASVLKARGDYSSAGPLYRAALAIRRRHLGESHPATAQSLNNLAAFLYAQGNYGEAEPLFREALELRRRSLGATHPDVAQGLNNLAAVLYAQESYAAAEPLYEQALEMRRALLGVGHPGYASSLYNLGVLQKAKGDYASATASLRESFERRRALLGEEHPDTATSLFNLAEVSYLTGEYGRADSLYHVSLAARRLALGNEHPHVAATLHRMGVCLKAAGDYSTAEPILEEACLVYDAARLRAGLGISRATFLKSPYADLAEAKLVLGNSSEAWPAAERYLARTLTDLLVTAAVRDLTEEELGREESLKASLAGCERDLSAYRRAAQSDGTDESVAAVGRARTALLEAEVAWSGFQREMSEKYPVSEGRSAALEDVQRTLPVQGAIIGWIDVEAGAETYRSWGYVVRNKGPVFWADLDRPGGRGSPIHEAFRALGEALADPLSSELGLRIDATNLWAERVAPLLPGLEGVTDLIVVPSGAALGIPIETLVSEDGTLLGERYSVSYALSSTLHALLWSRAARAGSGGESLLLGDPPFQPAHLDEMAASETEGGPAAVVSQEDGTVSAGAEQEDGARPAVSPQEDGAVSVGAGGATGFLATLTRLPGTRDEVLALENVVDAPVVLLGADASEEALIRFAESGRMAGFNLLHLATHAHVDDRVPGRSALVLSQVDLPDPVQAVAAGERVHDGVLTAREIVREWDLAADLVTLSACGTALGREAGGEGHIGLAHAFFQAGARSLLVSLWKVEDSATSLLMRRFYENRAGRRGENPSGPPMAKAEALREAKLWLREYTDESGRRPYHHPFYWSAFVLMGDRS